MVKRICETSTAPFMYKLRFEKQDTLNGQGTNQRRNNNTSESNIKHTTSRTHATKHDHLNTHTHAAHFCVCPFLRHDSTSKNIVRTSVRSPWTISKNPNCATQRKS